MRINWKVFEGNSSTEESVADFAAGEIKSYTAWTDACWPKETKAEIRKIRNSKLTIELVRKRARRHAHRLFHHPFD